LNALVHALVLTVLWRGPERAPGTATAVAAALFGVGGLALLGVLLERVPVRLRGTGLAYGRYGVVNLLLSGGLALVELALPLRFDARWGLAAMALGWVVAVRVFAWLHRWAPARERARTRWLLWGLAAGAGLGLSGGFAGPDGGGAGLVWAGAALVLMGAGAGLAGRRVQALAARGA
jgi:hypothetical protein